MKHKYAEMIKAKADNMELVLFVKRGESSTWGELNNHGDVTFLYEFDYFLCLPQHKEACLHWLNGGEVQDLFEGEWVYCASLARATESGGDNTLEFSEHHMFMNEEFQFRIAPKKEKRWIAVRRSDHYVQPLIYLSEGDADEDSPSDYWTHHEIEVEVAE
ncbi:hypothetical protein NVP1013O_65 [Vibrio phage 1.013.O._10N.286.54.F9]|nr:hypothetical protein NVP1013O_65 [Vibrio phage 1.013.O._10N.286.54.F9]